MSEYLPPTFWPCLSTILCLNWCRKLMSPSVVSGDGVLVAEGQNFENWVPPLSSWEALAREDLSAAVVMRAGGSVRIDVEELGETEVALSRVG